MRITELFVYPIKSCRGFSLAEVDVVERGLAGDRRYMLVDLMGTFITQRDAPRLALVNTRMDSGRVVVSAAGYPDVALELDATGERGELITVRVWQDSCGALVSSAGSAWFSDFLGRPVQLVYMPDATRRLVNPSHGRPGDIVSFADGYPCLLISQASLDDLNTRLPSPVPMQRFRPSIVVSGIAPYAEDALTQLTLGALSFRAVKRCQRCSVTTIDIDTGEPGKEPLATLARYRREEGKVWFGMNLIADGIGRLRVGDAGHTV